MGGFHFHFDDFEPEKRDLLPFVARKKTEDNKN